MVGTYITVILIVAIFAGLVGYITHVDEADEWDVYKIWCFSNGLNPYDYEAMSKFEHRHEEQG